MSENIDLELLARVIEESGYPCNREEMLQLIHDLIAEEFNVQHMIRPHKILVKLTAHLDAYNRE